MNRLKIALLSVAAVFFAASSANADTTASASASATVVAPLSIAKTSDLNFGKFVADADGGTVDSDTGAVGLVELPGPPNRSNAAFVVTGDESETYDVTLPASVTLNRTGGGGSMSATLAVQDGVTTNRSLPGGADDLNVKGVLTVGNNQAAGAYTGTFNVSVAY